MTTTSKLIKLGMERDSRLLKIAYMLKRSNKKNISKIYKDNLKTDNEMIQRFYYL